MTVMLFAFFLVFATVVHFCHGTPIHKTFNDLEDEDATDAKNFKRTLLQSQELNILDKISIINEGHRGKRLFEADIVLTDHDHVDTRNTGDVDGPIGSIVRRNAVRSRKELWKTRVVPYEIDSVISGNQLSVLKDAINDFNTRSCLKWLPKQSQDKNWVKFVKRDGCYSSVGMHYWKEGFQDLSLGGGCYGKGTIQHEMLHASGFWHEQSRSDRNQYVKVLWENIVPNMAYNFNKYTHANIDMLNKPYDYDSVMHYGKYAFSTNGKPTLQALGNPSRALGQRKGFSPTDIMELNALYDCKTRSGGWSDWSSYGPCDVFCTKYRQRFCTAEDRSKCPGANYYGIQMDPKSCPPEECNAPLDGHWGRWSSWGSCSTTCGEGRKTRTRLCDDPAPKNGGKDCIGSNTEQSYCKVRSCGLGPDDCEFNINFCFWTQDKSDTNPHPWELHTGTTPSSDTGPTGDHTSGSGNYIFAEASAPAATGNTARLISKIFPKTSGRCMGFWYSMYGAGMGALNVYLKDPETGAMQKIWSKSGNQGKSWKNGEVTIKRAAKYKVVFEAVRGVDFRSDIALDDVTFKDGSCTSLQTTTPAPTNEVVTPSPTQAPTVPPADRCNFGTLKGTLCTWINDPTNPKTPDDFYQFNWLTQIGHTPTSQTGPSSGHGGSGYYVYLETSSPYQPGMKGRLISTQYKASSSMCFDFWYFMYGSTVGSLTVYMENSSGRTNLWTKYGNQGNGWLEAKIPLSSPTDFKIIIEGTRGSNYYGDIAIDDTSISHGPCV